MWRGRLERGEAIIKATGRRALHTPNKHARCRIPVSLCLERRYVSMNRRQFLTGSTLLGATALAPTVAFADDSQEAQDGSLTPSGLPLGIQPEDFVQSCVELEPITEFAAEETYDIVVVGAGVSGVPAVLTALEEGASVCCLQKEEAVAANGSGETGFIKSACSEGALARFEADWIRANHWRVNKELFDYFIDHSEEAISWIAQKGIEAGLEPGGCSMKESVVYDDGTTVASFSVNFGGNATLMTAVAEMAEEQGAVFHYATPCVQLVQDETGRVTGAIGKTADGSYIKCNASSAVILAAGDYMNNDALVSRYCADLTSNPFDRRQVNRTGDGHILASLAGGRIVPAGHAKQVHDLSVSVYTMMSVPFLMLDKDGKRFFNEECSMSSWDVPLKYHYHDTYPIMFRIFDSLFADKYAECPNLATPELLEENQVPPENYNAKGIYIADTLEDLAANMRCDVDSLVASVEHYNELCAKGIDTDFGKPAQYMQPIDTPPFYGLKYAPGLAAINGGVHVDGNYQVLNAETWEPIPGLYACGVDAGDLCGGIDWTMPGGVSDGHCITAGRYTVIHALTGDLTPKNPSSFNDISDIYADEDGKFLWERPDQCNHEIVIW